MPHGGIFGHLHSRFNTVKYPAHALLQQRREINHTTFSNHNKSKNMTPLCYNIRSKRTLAYVLIVLLCCWELKISQEMVPTNPSSAKQTSRISSRISAVGGGSQQSSVVSTENEGPPSECRPLRDVSHLSTSSVRYPQADHATGRQNSKYASCLQFACDRSNRTRCDTAAPTVYDDPRRPPCCAHVLRDMAAAFDAVLCALGLEIYAAYGLLLGLVRDDRLVPWTADNDYVAPARTLAALLDLPPAERGAFAARGLAFFFDNYFHRLCVTPAFAGGALARRWTTHSDAWYPLVYPYADVFIAREEERYDSDNVSTGMYMVDQLGCAYPMSDYRPAQRRGVYRNSFHVSVPANAEAVLEGVYGPEWRVPDAKKHAHGDDIFRSQSKSCLVV